MKTLRSLLLRVAAALSLLGVLYAIKLPPGAPQEAGDEATRPLRVVLFVNGTLGDKSFYDSAARGLRAAQQQWGLRTRVIEAGLDPTRWAPLLTDVAESGDFDVIVTGGFAMAALVQRVAPRYPGARFVLFDAAPDAATCRCENVHSMLFRQNEGAYLAGLLAVRHAQMTAGPETAAGASPVLGVVGAMPIPVIDDFIVGFTAGARAAAPQATVLRQYVNSFTDPATGKEVAKALFGRGAHLVFHAAAGSGQGVIEAAAEAGRYAIGVDSDQHALFLTSQPRQAAAIVTSVMKNVDVALLRALGAAQARTLAYGEVVTLGLAEGGVSLAGKSSEMERLSPAVIDELRQVQAQIGQGQLQVPSAFQAPNAGGAP